MFAAALRTTALVVAMLAAWIIAGNAAYAVSAVSQPCHAARASSDVQARKVILALVKTVQAEGHHHNGGEHDQCHAGGMCCDAFCHAVMLTPEQNTTGVATHYAFYGMVADEGLFLRTAHGLDRPPRRFIL